MPASSRTFSPRPSRHSRRVGVPVAAALELDPRVQVLGVLAHDHDVGLGEARAHALVGLAGPDAGEQVQLLAQQHVDRAKARTHRRGGRALDPHLVALDRVQRAVGEGRALLGVDVLAGGVLVPLELHAGGLQHAPRGVDQLRAGAVAGDQRHLVGHRAGPFGRAEESGREAGDAIQRAVGRGAGGYAASVAKGDDKDRLDREGAIEQLNRALTTQYRSVLQYTVAAGSATGFEHQALSDHLWALRRPSSPTCAAWSRRSSPWAGEPPPTWRPRASIRSGRSGRPGCWRASRRRSRRCKTRSPTPATPATPRPSNTAWSTSSCASRNSSTRLVRARGRP